MQILDDQDETSTQPFRDFGESGMPLSRLAQARIGTQLRALYTELKEQPLPDRLVQLARQLEQKCQERVRGH